jgi:hypothetical protein
MVIGVVQVNPVVSTSHVTVVVAMGMVSTVRGAQASESPSQYSLEWWSTSAGRGRSTRETSRQALR